jgi:hypothetical protein
VAGPFKTPFDSHAVSYLLKTMTLENSAAVRLWRKLSYSRRALLKPKGKNTRQRQSDRVNRVRPANRVNTNVPPVAPG